MSTAAERKAARAGWSGQLFRGPDVHAQLDADAEAEWAAMRPEERLALSWELSLEQYGGPDGDALEPRLPRSAYRVERR